MNKIIKTIGELRDRFFYIFIGGNRTGKSVTARKHIFAWKKANPNRLVVGYDPQHRFSDLLDVIIDSENEDWCLELHKYRNCLIVIDEFRELHESNIPVKGLKKLLYNRDEWGLDFITIFHTPSLVLTFLTGYATHYFIFYANVAEGGFKDKIPDYLKVTLASKMVNKYVAKYGKGKFLDSKGNIDCKFPHMVFDKEKGKISGINMDKPI